MEPVFSHNDWDLKGMGLGNEVAVPQALAPCYSCFSGEKWLFLAGFQPWKQGRKLLYFLVDFFAR